MMIDIGWLQQRFPDVMGLTPMNGGGQRLVLSGRHRTEGDVVVKLFRTVLDPEHIVREILAVRSIGSSRIPYIYEAGALTTPIGPLPWLREQRIMGSDLRAILRQGPLQPTQILRIGLHLLEALAAAEKLHIVHRDVKPDNVKMASDGSAWLLDFGIARHLDLSSLTATSDQFGKWTAGYAPPEQARNHKLDIDGRSDLFALGVTLYECVQGTNPLIAGARDDLEKLRRTETQPLPRLARQVEPTGEFTDLVQAMTRIRRDQRPATVAEALDWMREICAREGIS